MDWFRLLEIAAGVVVSGVAIGAGVGGFLYAFKSKSNKLLKEQIIEVGDKFDLCHRQHTESLGLIHNLEGQVQTIKDIPLKAIANTLEGMSKVNQNIANSNELILKSLNISARIAAEDRGVLTHPNQNIDTQTVEQQIVNGQTKIK